MWPACLTVGKVSIALVSDVVSWISSRSLSLHLSAQISPAPFASPSLFLLVGRRRSQKRSFDRRDPVVSRRRRRGTRGRESNKRRTCTLLETQRPTVAWRQAAFPPFLPTNQSFKYLTTSLKCGVLGVVVVWGSGGFKEHLPCSFLSALV